MDEADRTNYEQEHPQHRTEDEFFERATERLDQALRTIAEAEERMARNVGRGRPPDRNTTR
jgi:hypothetical protein